MSGRENGGTPDLSAMLGAVLSNPSAMAMLSSLLTGKAAGGAAENGVATDGAAGGSPFGSGGASASPALPAMAPLTQAQPPQDERVALVYALRPFLPPEKCEMIDGLLRIMDLLFLIRGRRR